MSIREAVARAIVAKQMEQRNVRGTTLEEATAAITAFLQAAAQQGWHMRPDEATEEMVYQAEGISDFVLPEGLDNSKKGRWAEMKAALEQANAAAPEFEWDK